MDIANVTHAGNQLDQAPERGVLIMRGRGRLGSRHCDLPTPEGLSGLKLVKQNSRRTDKERGAGVTIAKPKCDENQAPALARVRGTGGAEPSGFNNNTGALTSAITGNYPVVSIVSMYPLGNVSIVVVLAAEISRGC